MVVSVSNPRFHFDDQPTFTSTVAADESDEDDDEDDQQDDFETAWQILDAARIIFEKDEGEAAKLKLADVLLCLGDVSLETEKFNVVLPDLAHKEVVQVLDGRIRALEQSSGNGSGKERIRKGGQGDPQSLFGGMLNNDGKLELAKPSNPDAPVNDLSTLVKPKAKDTEVSTGKRPK
ncbi:hypothetical protein DM01DRAFT_1370640 [Hesseltinella vesiculosa]|uniref:Tetratricopeptide SHNi-TPR domain-containing protein n=1 Tax=Hesseltinella vesiculosa TaxID=101127 RepID=A0A1X2GUC4_9FUNG|nr:hypothetical protein DM01DRAFT_1370640 [Hesseltinella vesiculosa]